jgi:hypothetical protein
MDDMLEIQEGDFEAGVVRVASNGLVGTYYDNIDFTNPKSTRVDATVNFDWGQGSPDSNIGAETFSVRWTGFVKAKYSQTYTFTTRSDDGVRLWVNNQKIIENWTNHAPTDNKGTIALQAGVVYPIKLEYYENYSGAVVKLLWSSSSQSQEVIPSAQLFTGDPSQTSRCAEGGQDNTLTLSCPAGQTITTINFASYGTPTGSCPNFQAGSCHASNSKSFVEAACLYEQSCSLLAVNAVFGDPCSGTKKKLAVAYTCSDETTNSALKSFVGHYEHTPILNNWHKVDISVENNALWWRNAAGVRWSLSYASGVLMTGSDCPYGARVIDVETQPGSDAIKSLKFLGSSYYKSPTPTVYKMEQGRTENRVHLVLIGDGYTFQELSTVYADHVQSMLDYMFSSNKNAPYPRYKKFINRYRIDIPSAESGVDNPEKGIYRNTALGGEAACSDYPRTCQVNFDLTHKAIYLAAASTGITPHWRLALLNNDTYQNGAHWVGAPLAVYSARCPGWWDIRDLALHEGAHAWHGLWDEYIYKDRVWLGGPEPSGINVSADSSGSKWSRWLGYKMRNGYDIGVFEGASGYEFGLYRPSFSSKMNGGPGDCHYIGNDCGHNMIGIEKIIQDIYKIVRPVDAHRDNSATLFNPADVWVKVVDPDVIKVDWYINGVLRVAKGSQKLSLKDYITAKGTYKVTARCYDEVVEHAFSDNKNPHPLDLVRSGLDKLEQSVSWTVRISQVQ